MKECNSVKQSPIAGLAAYGGGAGSVLFGRKGVDGYTIDRSVRFDSGESTYLSRTPSSAGNRKTFTFAAWIKLSDVGTGKQTIFNAGNNSSFGQCLLEYDGSYNQFWFRSSVVNGTMSAAAYTTALFRDPGAWYHLVMSVDTTQATAADRVKMYVNGVSQSFVTYSIPQDGVCAINTATEHRIGRSVSSNSDYLDSYLADVHFIDGTALDASNFGAYDADTGIWNPKRFSGSFGTNGFHLKFASYSSSAALGTDSSGNSNTWTVNNMNIAASTFGASRGSNYDTEASSYTEFGTVSQVSGQSLPMSNPSHYQTYALRANSGGFKVITTNSASTEFFMGCWIKLDNHTAGNQMGVDIGGSYKYWEVRSDGNVKIRHVSPGSSATSSGSPLSTGTWQHIALSRSGNTLTGFVDGTAVVTTTCGYASNTITANEEFNWFAQSGTSYNVSGYLIDAFVYVGTGRTSNYTVPTAPLITSTGGINNVAGFSSSYLVYASNLISYGAGVSDISTMIDTPTNYEADSGNNGGNYATLNPLTRYAAELSNGNLDVLGDRANDWSQTLGTLGITSGKYYWEYTVGAPGSTQIGICQHPSNDKIGAGPKGYGYILGSGRVDHNNSDSAYGESLGAGNVLGIAYDADNGKLYFYKDGTIQNSGTAAATGISSGTWFPGISIYHNTGNGSFNFGQRPFAISSIPSGYKALCTQNLPDPTIADGSTVFDTVLWTGNGSSPRDISGYSFSPDLVWYKQRDQARDHQIYDTVRGSGTNKSLASNTQYSETANDDELYGYLSAFNSDGFEVTTGSTNDNYNNNNGSTYVGWAWDAGSLDTIVNVGGKNSSAYNTSDTWSDDLSSPNGAYNNSPVTNAFNGSLTSGFEAGNPSSGYSTIRFQPATAITVNTQIRIYVFDYNDGSVTYQYRVNDGSWNNMPGESSSPYRAWRDLGFTGSLSSFEYRSNTSITYKPTLFAVEIDGALLIDSGTDLSGFTQYPSLATTLRANASAGFSIVTYTGDGNNSKTAAHGLNVAPQMIFYKRRDDAGNWKVYHYTQTATKLTNLNGASAFSSNNDIGTAPTSGVISVSSSNSTYLNYNNATYVAYCFAPVEGYSAFGSYAGTGQADGPFIYTGFRPRLIMIKDATSSGWFHVHDTARDPENVSGARLFWGDSNSEQPNDSAYGFDLLSNGFKLRNSHSESNDSGQTYIYAAWAENPIKTARAR